MKRIFSTLYTVLISVLITSLAFAGGIPGTIGNMPPMAPQGEHGQIFLYDASRNPTLDFESRTKLSQTYAYTGRYRTNAQGNQELVPANTVVIDHIGASLEPALRMEPEGMNLLFGSNDFSAAGGYTLSNVTTSQNAVGPSGAANEAWTIRDASGAFGYVWKRILKSVSDSTTYFQDSLMFAKTTGAATFPGFGFLFYTGTADKTAWYTLNTNTGVATAYSANDAANISALVESKGAFWKVTVSAQDNGANAYFQFRAFAAVNTDGSATWDAATQGSCVIANGKITTGAIPSSYFAGAAAIGSEGVTNGNFSAVVDNVGELSSGLLTVGNCYKISARTDSDFTAVGSPDNVVGTYFNATATGADGILDAGDKVFPVTIANWTGLPPQAVAGALTGKAVAIASSVVFMPTANMGTANGEVYRVQYTIASSAGSVALRGTPTNANSAFTTEGLGDQAASGNTTAVWYRSTVRDGRVVLALNAFTGTIDDVSMVSHGTGRITEAGTITLVTPAKVSAALAATGTFVVRWMPSWSKAALSTNGVVLTTINALNPILYASAGAGVLTTNDSSGIATSAAAYVANAFMKNAVQWPSDTNKFKIGTDLDGAGIVYGSEAAFDGTFADDGTTRLGFTLPGPMWIQWIKIYNSLITNAQVNSM